MSRKLIENKPYPCACCEETIIEDKIAQTVIYCFQRAMICADCIKDLAKYQNDPMIDELIDLLKEPIAIFVNGDNIAEYTSPDSKFC